jgi:hypothetical protein
MNYQGIDIRDLFGFIAVATVLAGLLLFTYLQYRLKRRRTEIIHQERMVAMEKGIPLPEFPNLDIGLSPFLLTRLAAKPASPQASLLTGIIFLCVSVGGMIVLFFLLPLDTHLYWILPLPLALVGIGLLLYYALFRRSAT